MNQYQDIWFFGRVFLYLPLIKLIMFISLGTYTTNFTATNNLFLSNPLIEYWRFEVVYSFSSETTSSALNFIINQPPQNGSCSISPLSGTTSTLFTVSCQDWEDQDGIQDYSIYSTIVFLKISIKLFFSIVAWTTDRSQLLMTAFTFVSDIRIRLPPGDDITSIVNLVVYIRDTLGCVTEYNMTFVIVLTDTVAINDFIDSIQTSTNAANANPIVRILAGGNQNVIGQMIISLSQIFNKMNTENIDNAISSKSIPSVIIGDIKSLSFVFRRWCSCY